MRSADELERLERIKTLWGQLRNLRQRPTEYKALVNRIKKESDEFIRLIEGRTPEEQ
jgi:hypothetical protein